MDGLGISPLTFRRHRDPPPCSGDCELSVGLFKDRLLDGSTPATQGRHRCGGPGLKSDLNMHRAHNGSFRVRIEARHEWVDLAISKADPQQSTHPQSARTVASVKRALSAADDLIGAE